MGVRSSSASVILVAALACTPDPHAGGPTSDFPIDPRNADAGAAQGSQDAGPFDSDDEDSGETAGDGGTSASAADAAAVPASEGGCLADAGVGDAQVDAAVDAEVDAAIGDASAPRIAEDANFTDSSASDGAAADGSSDAPYTSGDAQPCIP